MYSPTGGRQTELRCLQISGLPFFVAAHCETRTLAFSRVYTFLKKKLKIYSKHFLLQTAIPIIPGRNPINRRQGLVAKENVAKITNLMCPFWWCGVITLSENQQVQFLSKPFPQHPVFRFSVPRQELRLRIYRVVLVHKLIFLFPFFSFCGDVSFLQR